MKQQCMRCSENPLSKSIIDSIMELRGWFIATLLFVLLVIGITDIVVFVIALTNNAWETDCGKQFPDRAISFLFMISFFGIINVVLSISFGIWTWLSRYRSHPRSIEQRGRRTIKLHEEHYHEDNESCQSRYMVSVVICLIFFIADSLFIWSESVLYGTCKDTMHTIVVISLVATIVDIVIRFIYIAVVPMTGILIIICCLRC